MGYNLKNARNGKSISKIPKWQSLRSLALKNEILWRFEFQKNKKICMEIVGNSFSISGILKVAVHNFMKSRSRDGLAAKGLFPLVKCSLCIEVHVPTSYCISTGPSTLLTPWHHKIPFARDDSQDQLSGVVHCCYLTYLRNRIFQG